LSSGQGTVFPAPVTSPGEPFERSELQALLWADAGLFRTAGGLQHARSRLGGWGAPPGDSFEALEDRNLLDLARLLVDAALGRRESRGAHYRDDYPEADPRFARHSRVRATPVESAPAPTKDTSHALV
jgi:L-aspartate oxidase